MKPAFVGLLFAIVNASALAQWFLPSPDTCIDDPITTTKLENTPTITTQLEDIPSTAGLLATASAQNATAEQLNVHISVYQSVYLELCSTGLRPVTTTITETCTKSTFTTATGLRLYVTAAAFTESTFKPTSTYTTLTVFRAPASPSSFTRTPGTTRLVTSNWGTATIQPFSGDATIMYLNFSFAVSVMGIFIVSFCLL
jgi:hypothetical protein